MRLDRSWVIAKREYLSRIRTVGFWVGTVILPVFMVAMAVLPSLLMVKLRGTIKVAVVDETGQIASKVVAEIARAQEAEAGTDDAQSVPGGRDRRPEASAIAVEIVPLGNVPTEQRAALDRRVLAKEVDAWVWISQAGLEAKKATAEYHGENVSNFVTQARLENAIERAVRHWRLTEAGFDAGRIAELSRGVNLTTTRITAAGSREEGGIAGFFLAYILFFLLFLVLVIYGQQVLNGVLEEKTSRIVEVIISTVTPFELMVGKLLGICGVASTQIVIWLATAVAVTTPGILAGAAMGGFTLPKVPLSLAFHFLAFFILGFFTYASIYAALGSAYNDIKEAQQAASSLQFLLMPCFLLMFPVINDPDSNLSIGASFFPFFTPLLMMLRIAVKAPPAWQIALGYVLSIGAVIALVWMCAKIYRVGILMYGKKPTLPEMWKWLRYS